MSREKLVRRKVTAQSLKPGVKSALRTRVLRVGLKNVNTAIKENRTRYNELLKVEEDIRSVEGRMRKFHEISSNATREFEKRKLIDDYVRDSFELQKLLDKSAQIKFSLDGSLRETGEGIKLSDGDERGFNVAALNKKLKEFDGKGRPLPRWILREIKERRALAIEKIRKRKKLRLPGREIPSKN